MHWNGVLERKIISNPPEIKRFLGDFLYRELSPPIGAQKAVKYRKESLNMGDK